MLGYTQPNNDVYIFFENNEIEGLKSGTIRGTYFNLTNTSVTGLLKASIDDTIDDRFETLIQRNDDGFVILLHLKMRLLEYQRLTERRSFEEHQGFRHICLRDANHLGFLDNMNYIQLKYRES